MLITDIFDIFDIFDLFGNFGIFVIENFTIDSDLSKYFSNVFIPFSPNYLGYSFLLSKSQHL